LIFYLAAKLEKNDNTAMNFSIFFYFINC